MIDWCTVDNYWLGDLDSGDLDFAFHVAGRFQPVVCFPIDGDIQHPPELLRSPSLGNSLKPGGQEAVLLGINVTEEEFQSCAL